jgi:tetratricopeptide (TPR) repeat protein
MNLILPSVLAATLAASWWLSGYDSRLSGQEKDRRADFIRRAVRCGATLLLAGFGTHGLLYGGMGGGMKYIMIVVPIAVIWAGCLSELFARGFHQLIDPEDKREFDPKQTSRELARLADLVQNGREREAIELCRQLNESADASALAVEAVLLQLYDRMFAGDRLRAAPALAEALRLRGRQMFDEAESALNLLLKQEPDNLAAAVLLMQVCAQDLFRPDKAKALLEIIRQQSRTPPLFVEYARHCIDEWSGAVPRREKTAEGIESLLVEHKQPQAPKKAGGAKEAS